MTRINVVKPGYLLDQHLMAEYREIPMVPAALTRTLDSCQERNAYDYVIPRRYTLGEGHVSFFYDKRDYLEQRYSLVMKELRRRGYILDPYRCVSFHVHDEVPPYGKQSWQPTAADIKLNLSRILTRVAKRPDWYRYKGKIVTETEYRNALAKRGLL